ncbi:type VII secretion-associated serine protease mycosin [Pseudonocardia sp. CNS-139]|nr:type VII secretion-associated serine protease mycosin [Pseudonocardia sp. CNS-139]
MPSAAPGLVAPERCTPPAADGAPAGTGPAVLRLADVHRVATGRGQVVAVIDTGVAPHPLLAGRLTGAGDYLTGGSGLTDCDGHGTAVAGLVAAAPVGIAPGARVLAIRQSSPSHTVPGPDGPRPPGDTDTLAEAVVLAVRSGAGVVNVSEAVCLPPDRAAAAGARLQAALRYAADAGTVVVAAAGNAGSGSCTADADGRVALPGWYDDHVLTVGATGPDGRPAAFSVPGPWVDVAAPGTGLRSLAVDGGTTAEGVTGTSFAAPWVAGLAALVRERYPQLSAAEVVERIVATARPVPDPAGAAGAGVVDPLAALRGPAGPAVTELRPGPPRTRRRSTRWPRVGGPAGPAVTELAGPAPDPPPDGVPVDLVATAVLVGAAALAAAVVRGRPRGSPGGRPGDRRGNP